MKTLPGGISYETLPYFWNKIEVKEEDDCWNWKEACWSNGYGRFKWKYQSWRSHRFVLYLLNRIPENYPGVVRHLCHNVKCCNPKHLSPGSHQDNMEDLKAKNRGITVEEYHRSLGQ